ncbi:unnamed protein product [Oreochromis niloticus]|nr:unnamed protein product [Mustela putorius furo]
MRLKIFSCLLVFILGCSAGRIQRVIKQKESIALPCPGSVEGKVMWSRESEGRKVDLLLVDGDRDIRLVPDPHKRFSSLADKSLYIFKATRSETGKYYCNNDLAAELTVTPSGSKVRGRATSRQK